LRRGDAAEGNGKWPTTLEDFADDGVYGRQHRDVQFVWPAKILAGRGYRQLAQKKLHTS
jgi:hypothetical protein